ncbi:hypothetical protein DRE_06688 [Drechslerella stenobrocha 248]|uniref:Uncharacterized protein n=1 Tax=Drechslerella stenobrocha 248 TaxID=1043628 RepID=W7HKJ0_9PEZI|nr:hypothetical protein DRE_06688 [Drechslerella stenobrocha 248]
MQEDTHHNLVLLGVLAALAAAVWYTTRGRFRKQLPLTPLRVPPLAHKPLRTFTPAEIAALGRFPNYAALTGVPLPAAYSNFDISRAKPRPYRPFRWPYHQTMALSRMQADWWLELESTYVARMAQRKELHERYGRKIVNELPDESGVVKLACRELMEMVLQFLARRYPMYFELDEAGLTFRNRVLGIVEDLGAEDIDPLMVVFRHVAEDFAVMVPVEREREGVRERKYVFMAGVICSSLGWDVGTKIGKTVGEIHAGVPDYRDKMSFSMDRYFSRLTTDKPIQRGSWGVEVGEPLFMPAGDPHESLRKVQDPALKEDELTVRVDWQTLRRLPLSNAIVFNYKAVFTPLAELADEPGVPALLEKVLVEGSRQIMEYKGTWHIEHVALPMLERMRRAQAASGVWAEGREVCTFAESPFYPGWEEKWHRQQGF